MFSLKDSHIKILIFSALITLLLGSHCFAQVLITNETFDESYGAIEGTMSNGEPWEANVFGSCDNNPGFWGVDNGDFVCNNMEGFNCCNCDIIGGSAKCGDNKNEMNFGPIDISAFQGVSFYFDISHQGDMECGSIPGGCPSDPYDGCYGGNDQIIFYYSIDGSAYEIFEYYCGDMFCYQDAPQVCNLDGNELNIKIHMGNQAMSEYYFIHDLSVYGYTEPPAQATATPNIICEGEDVQLNEIANNAVSWEWSGPNGFSSTLQNPLLTNVSVSDGGIYTVVITDANDCTEESSIEITVNESPLSSLAGTLEFCPGDCNEISLVIQGGTPPYGASFELTIGSTSLLFTIPQYDINNQLVICYTSDLAPYYESTDNILFIPLSITGSGSLTLISLIDGNNCEPQTIVPNNTVLVFKEVLDIPATNSLEECDYNFDKEATFNLTTLEDDLTGNIGGLYVNWYKDEDCTISIYTSSSYTTNTTTVYVFLSDDYGDKCNSDTLPVELIVLSIPNPGESNIVDICDIETCFDLINNLGGTPEPGGQWEDDNNTGIDLSTPDCVNISVLDTGSYNFTYKTFDFEGKCDTISATLTIIVSEPGNPGKDGYTTFCGPPKDSVDLENYIVGVFDSIGTWRDSIGNIIQNPNSLDMSDSIVGSYFFYYSIDNNNCGMKEAVVTINIIAPLSAGNDSTLYVCPSGSNTIENLEDALGIHNAGGKWHDIDTSGVDLTNPAFVNFSGFSIDTFHYSYIIENDSICPADDALITVIIESVPFANNNSFGSICIGSTDTVNLFDYLVVGFDSTGIWKQIGGDSLDISEPQIVLFNNASVGIDSFRYITSGSCGSDTANIYIEITASLQAGDNFDFLACENTILNLFDSLTNYSIGGIWINNTNDTISDPTSISHDNAGLYRYMYILPEKGACIGDTAIGVITVLAAPKAGYGIDFSICESSSNQVDLYHYITGYSDSGGIWEDSIGNIIDNPQNFSFSSFGTGQYVFKYILPGNEYCNGDTAKLTITIVKSLQAGNDNSIVICNNDTNIKLSSLLGSYDEGGNWIDLDNSGVNIQSSNGEIVSFENIEQGIYRYQYKIAATDNCQESSAIITVTVNPTTTFDFTEEVCPDQDISIGNSIYNLSNPTGTEVLTNVFGCDSIVNINLIKKETGFEYYVENANCFGSGKFVLQSLSGIEIPATLIIHSIDTFSIDNLPFTVQNVPSENYTLYISGNNGCEVKVGTFTIEAFVPYDIDIKVIKNPDNYLLNVVSNITAKTIKWNPTKGLTCDNCLTVVATPDKDINYIVTLTDADGCSVSDTTFLTPIIVNKDNTDIYIPNIFTPEGDGYNDKFYAKSNKENATYDMYIYDRWGEKIYASKDLNFNSEVNGWDGIFKGKKALPGVYIFMIIVKYDQKDQGIYTGDLLLVR